MHSCTITILIRNQFYEKVLLNFHACIGLFERKFDDLGLLCSSDVYDIQLIFISDII